MTPPADHREAATLGPAGSPSSGDRSLTIAFLHLAPELGALDRNRSLIEYGTRVAADSGADWVLSGELVVPGYRFEPLIGTKWIAEQPDRWMRRLAWRRDPELQPAGGAQRDRPVPRGAGLNAHRRDFSIDQPLVVRPSCSPACTAWQRAPADRKSL
jgi:hypothetical protein